MTAPSPLERQKFFILSLWSLGTYRPSSGLFAQPGQVVQPPRSPFIPSTTNGAVKIPLPDIYFTRPQRHLLIQAKRKSRITGTSGDWHAVCWINRQK